MVTRSVLKFESFEVDPSLGELRKDGLRIPIQEKPLRVLAALAERPGELVTRVELHQQLWQGEEFVDFDNGLNTAVRKLRIALGDESESPRFIETIPRRGYRFLAPVERVNGAAAAQTRRDADAALLPEDFKSAASAETFAAEAGHSETPELRAPRIRRNVGTIVLFSAAL